MLSSELLAAAAYLLPTVVWVCLRVGGGRSGTSRGIDESQLAVEVPVGVAVDLLTVLLLARFFRLETATLLSRSAWALGGGIAAWRWWRRGGRPRLPDAGQRRRVLELALVAMAGLLVSLRLSRRCAIWDRDWHIPLVTALRGQRLPFMNVYDASGGLFYHFAGDVQAAMLQTLSGGRLHASLALSLSHDLSFALIALSLVCFLRRADVRGAALGLLVFAAVVMTGPVTFFRDGVRKLDSGFAIVNYLTLSFRPHVPLAYLLELGFLQIVLAGLLSEGRDQTPLQRLARLAPIAAALVVTDESSLGMLGLALGVLWLCDPSILGPRRRVGLIGLGVLLATMAAALVLFVGAVGPGAPHYEMHLVPPRAPGYAAAALPLATEAGRAVLLQDLLPVLGVLAGTILLAIRTRDRVLRGMAVFYGTLLLASVWALTCLDFEHKASESHRFVTALFITGPPLAAVALARAMRAARRPASACGAIALALYATVGLGVASTLEWLESGVALRQCGRRGFAGLGADQFYDLDCRGATDAHLGERTVPSYVEAGGFYLWAGCHPVFASAPPLAPGAHKVKIGAPWHGRGAVEEQRDRLRGSSQDLQVVCLPAGAWGPRQDPVCGRAQSLVTCLPRGPLFTSCAVNAAGRDALPGAL